MKKKLPILAKIISQVFSPFICLPSLFIYQILQKYQGIENQLFTSSKFLLITIIPTVIVLLFLKQQKIIKSFDMTDRRERYLFNIIALVLYILLLIFVDFFGFGKILNHIILVFVSFLVLALITFFWKISGHLFGVTLFILEVFGLTVWGLFLGLPIVISVAWSRVYLKRHTVGQVVGGIILSLTAFSLAKLLQII